MLLKAYAVQNIYLHQHYNQPMLWLLPEVMQLLVLKRI